MAHPYHMHREHQVGHRRVNEMMKGEPAGAKKHAKSDAFSKVTSKSAAENHEHKVSGKKAVGRYARGGKVKGAQTNIAIIMPGAKGGAAGGAGGAGPMPGGPPMPPMMPPPPPGAGGPPPGGPPPMPMRARGGRTNNIDGESTKADLKKWANRAEANSYARGGAAKKMTAGAASGVGREEKAGIRRK